MQKIHGFIGITESSSVVSLSLTPRSQIVGGVSDRDAAESSVFCTGNFQRVFSYLRDSFTKFDIFIS